MKFRILHFNTRLFIPLLVVIGITIIINIYGYVFVLTGPQHAYLKYDSKVSAQSIVINNKKYNISEHWEVRIDNPHIYLGGVDDLSLINIGENETSDIQIGIVFNLNKIHNLQATKGIIEIPLSDVVSGLFVHIKDEKNVIEYFGNKICTSKFYSIDFKPKATDVEGNLTVSNFEQSLKKLKISGRLNIEETQLNSYTKNICSNPMEKPNVILSLEIQNIMFSIDSPVIYEWSNKAGKTWRL